MQMTRAGAWLALLALIGALGAVAGGCAGRRPGGAAPNWREEGLASWYGSDFHGRRTANGERYNMYAMTAAHKTLPLGTPVVVTSRESGRRITVRINDRGPFVAGRIIDLSYAAARALGSADAGVVPVIVEAALPDTAFLTPPPAYVAPRPAPAVPTRVLAPASTAPPPLRGAFAVQVGSFAVEANARRLAASLPVPHGMARVATFEDNRGAWWRVRVVGYESEIDADAAAAAFAETGLTGYVVRED
jgi:rare lipoprotein A